MGRYVFRFSGSGAAPDGADEILQAANIHVVDSSSRMYLVEGEEDDVQRAVRQLPGWSIHAERTYTIPDPRQKLRDQ